VLEHSAASVDFGENDYSARIEIVVSCEKDLKMIETDACHEMGRSENVNSILDGEVCWFYLCCGLGMENEPQREICCI
jgi:hypothetical protein